MKIDVPGEVAQAAPGKEPMDNHWIEWLLGAWATLLTWLGTRAVGRLDDHETRLRAVETDRVTHNDIDELRQSLTASIVNVGARAENNMRDMREDRASMHRENQAFLERIVDKIDANEERSAKTRHETLDQVNALALKMAVNGLK
jgi:hypothetical protein